jgi:Endonuclease NucS
MDEKIGVWHAVVGSQPTRLIPENVPFEKHLETWIFEDMSLVSPTLQRIGRQVQIEGKIMDILAIEEPGIWVICEIKKTALYRDSVAQAIDYVARFDRQSISELRALVEKHSAFQTERTKALVERALDREKEGEARDIRVVLAGVGVKEDLSHIVSFLSDKYSFPISVSAYSAIAAPGDDQGFLLLRDISEDSNIELETKSESQDYESRMSAVRSNFLKSNQLEIFELLNKAFSNDGHFYVRPWKKAIMIAPKSHHGRYLAYYTSNVNGIRAMVSKDSILEFFPDAHVDMIPEAMTDTYLRTPSEATEWSNVIIESVKNSTESLPSTFKEWNGKDWYVAFGDDEGRRWSDARKYGFVSAGGGEWYSRTFKAVPVGARVFVYIPSIGYVGVGVTTSSAVPFEKSHIFGNKDLDGTYIHKNGEPEFILPIEWKLTLSPEEAFKERGLFASQHSACKLRDQKTLKVLYSHFNIQESI